MEVIDIEFWEDKVKLSDGEQAEWMDLSDFSDCLPQSLLKEMFDYARDKRMSDYYFKVIAEINKP